MNPRNPVAAALSVACLIASLSAGAALAASKPGQVVKQTGSVCAAGAVKNNDPIAEIACLISEKSSPARADVGARFLAFMESADADGKAFIAPGAAKDSTKTAALRTAAVGWAAAKPAVDVARLYFVMGPGAGPAPAWVVQDALLGKTFKPEMSFAKKLRTALKKFTGTIRSEESVSGFLEAASEEALKIMRAAKKGKDIKLPAGKEKEDAVTAGGSSGASSGRSLSVTATGFGVGDLYGEPGAKVGKVNGAGEGYREFSIKIYTVKDGGGNFENKLGLLDVTPSKEGGPLEPHGTVKLFALHQDLEETVSMGGRDYVVSIKTEAGRRTVVVKRAEAEGADARSLSTAVEELEKSRLEQIRGNGWVDIGGKPHYVLGQGGSKGSLLFFSKAEVDKGTSGVEPAVMADVSEFARGRTRRIQGEPPLGNIGGKDWCLAFDEDLQMWKIKEGKGTQPKTEPAVDGKAAAALAELAAKFPDWTRDEQENKKLDAETAAKLQIMKKGKVFGLLVPGSEKGLIPLEGTIRGLGKFVAVAQSKGVFYFSPDDLVAGDSKNSGTFTKSNGMREAKDVSVALDILKTHMQVQKPDEALLKKAVGQFAGNGVYAFSAKGKGPTVSIETEPNGNCMVWRKWGECDKKGGSGEPQAEGGGSGAGYVSCDAIDNASNGERLVRYDGSGAVRVAAGTIGDDICLYQVQKAGKAQNRYELRLRYKGEHGDAIASAGVFNGDFAKPERLTYKSLGGQAVKEITAGSKINSIQGSNAERGVYGFFRTGSQSSAEGTVGGVKNKEANCLGAVLWWGLEEAEALQACKAGRIEDDKSWWKPW